MTPTIRPTTIPTAKHPKVAITHQYQILPSLSSVPAELEAVGEGDAPFERVPVVVEVAVNETEGVLEAV
jgi:hypothetical protein